MGKLKHIFINLIWIVALILACIFWGVVSISLFKDGNTDKAILCISFFGSCGIISLIMFARELIKDFKIKNKHDNYL